MRDRTALLQPVGINGDLPRHRVPPEQWTDGSNVSMRQGVPARIEGSEEIYSGVATAQNTWLFPVLTTSTAYWIYSQETAGAGSDTDIYVTDGTTAFDITPAGGVSNAGLQNPFTAAMLNGVPCFNWQTEPPAFWGLDTGTAAADLTGWESGATCKALRAHRNYLIAMDYTDGSSDRFEQMIRFSDAAEPGTVPVTWIPAASNDAGFRTASETEGPVIDGISLGADFLVFKNNSVYRLRFIGGQFVFELELLPFRAGVLTRNCLAKIDRRNVVAFGDGDIWLTDGANATSIAHKAVRNRIFDSINGEAFERSFLAHYPAASEVWCCYATGNNEYPDTAAVWDTREGAWSFRSLDSVQFAASGIVESGDSDIWDDDDGFWNDDNTFWDEGPISEINDLLVTTLDGGGFVQVDSGNTDQAGADVEASLVRESFDHGKPLAVKQVVAVWPNIEGRAGDTVRVSVGEQENVSDPIMWSAEVDCVIGTTKKVDIFARGKYLSYRFRSTGGAAWQLPQFTVEFGSTGARY